MCSNVILQDRAHSHVLWCVLIRTFCPQKMFSLLRTVLEYIPDVNTINTWAEPHNANGVTPNTIIDSNDEPAGNNQQRIAARNY